MYLSDNAFGAPGQRNSLLEFGKGRKFLGCIEDTYPLICGGNVNGVLYPEKVGIHQYSARCLRDVFKSTHLRRGASSVVMPIRGSWDGSTCVVSTLPWYSVVLALTSDFMGRFMESESYSTFSYVTQSTLYLWDDAAALVLCAKLTTRVGSKAWVGAWTDAGAEFFVYGLENLESTLLYSHRTNQT